MTDPQYDAIILLGASINADASIVDTDKVRLETVADLYKNHATTSIVVCGSYGYKSAEKPVLTEAQAYADYLESLGVPHDAIYLESESQETLGNLLFTKMRILMAHDWHNILVIPTFNHSTERINYLAKKILGSDYTWQVLRVGENNDQTNHAREEKSLMHTQSINDIFADGDHDAIYKGLMETHPAYGGTKWTIDELRNELKH